jgi:hypothetical protein
LFLAALGRDGQQRLARNLAAPGPFLNAVGCECLHCWYWLADACRDDVLFALGHAWAVKAVHGSKTKCDRHDAQAIARLLRGGNLPLAYAYPKERRGLRDLLRARLRLVRQRAKLYGHVHTARRRANLPPVSNDVKYKSRRGAITADPFVRRRVETHLGLLEPLDTAIRRLEAEIEEAAKGHYPTERKLGTLYNGTTGFCTPQRAQYSTGKAVKLRTQYKLSTSQGCRLATPHRAAPKVIHRKAARRTKCPGAGQNSSLFETSATSVARRATPLRPSVKWPIPAASPAATSAKADQGVARRAEVPP